MHTWKNTAKRTDLILRPASGSCSMKSGFFLLFLETFSKPWKPPSGIWPISRSAQALQLSLQAFKRSIWHSSTIVSPQKTLLFHLAKKDYFASVARRDKVWKMKAGRKRLQLFRAFAPQTITNSGSDDTLILSSWVCETAPSVCFPLIRVMAINIIATVPHDKLLHAKMRKGLWVR